MRSLAAFTLTLVISSSLLSQDVRQRLHQATPDKIRLTSIEQTNQRSGLNHMRGTDGQRTNGDAASMHYSGMPMYRPDAKRLRMVKRLQAGGVVYLPDTVVVYHNAVNKTRHLYSYDANGSILTERHEFWEGGWLFSDRLIYTYDANGNLLARVQERWDGTQYHRTYTYDTNGNMLTFLYEHWDGTQWVRSRMVNTYDTNGNLLTELSEHWDGTQWVRNRLVNTYDANGNLLTYLLQHWDGTQWVDNLSDFRYYWTYDGSGNRLTQLREYWNGEQFVLGQRQIYTYDANGKMLTTLLQGQSDNINGWMNNFLYTWTYDANGNMLAYVSERWDGTQWIPYGPRHTHTYDASGNQLTYLEETWDGTQWENSRRDNFAYDSSSNLIHYKSDIWSDSTWVIFQNYYAPWGAPQVHLIILGQEFLFVGYDITLSYTQINGANVPQLSDDAPILFELSQNYPNPFNPSTTLRCGVPVRSNVTLTIYNTLGQRITQFDNNDLEPGTYEQGFDASYLPSGLYFYRMEAASIEDPKKVFVQTRKMILLK